MLEIFDERLRRTPPLGALQQQRGAIWAHRQQPIVLLTAGVAIIVVSDVVSVIVPVMGATLAFGYAGQSCAEITAAGA